MTEAVFTESLASWMQRQRRVHGVTQRALAISMGVKRSTVGAWELGTRNVSAFQYLQLKQFFAKCEAQKKSTA